MTLFSGSLEILGHGTQRDRICLLESKNGKPRDTYESITARSKPVRSHGSP